MSNEIYIEHGYTSRQHYLEELSFSTGMPLDMVQELASLFGPEEDFDGLVTALEDAAEDYFDDDASWFDE